MRKIIIGQNKYHIILNIIKQGPYTCLTYPTWWINGSIKKTIHTTSPCREISSVIKNLTKAIQQGMASEYRYYGDEPISIIAEIKKDKGYLLIRRSKSIKPVDIKDFDYVISLKKA